MSRVAELIAIAVVLIVVLLVLHAAASLYTSRRTAANRSWVGSGAAVGAFVLRSDRLQSVATNPYYSAFAGLAAGTTLESAFPSVTNGVYASRPSPLVTPDGAPLWIVYEQGLKALLTTFYSQQVTPAAAQSKLAALVSDPSNASQMFSLVRDSVSSGALLFQNNF